MTLSDVQKAEVRATMEQYATAYKNKDIRGLLTVFSPDMCGYGSGVDEVIRNKNEFIRQIRRDISQATINSVNFTDTQIFGEGRIAWLMTKSAITFTIPGAGKKTMNGRSTMVMRNTGNRWVIEQFHFAMPYGGQVEGQSFPGA